MYFDKIRVLSLFSGLGAFEKALTRLEIPYTIINYCEKDKFAQIAYSLIHNIPQALNLGDISSVNEKIIPSYDLLIFGSPCTNISKVGKREGINGEKSKVFYDAVRILNYTKPKYFVFENVNTLVTSNNGEDYKVVQALLSEHYNIYADFMSAKDYQVPQSRKRLIIVGINKDINFTYSFPEASKLECKFTDLLEEYPNKKYYLSENERNYMDRKTADGRTHWDFGHFHDTQFSTSRCIVANTHKGVPYNVLADRRKCKTGHYDCDFIDNCNSDECIDDSNYQHTNMVTSGERKLTPLECLRLMNFDDNDFYILKQNNISDSQIFKMAGNSIPVKILENVFSKLLMR